MRRKLARENYGGEICEYVPLGKHVVMAKGICGGRPTFKYTRLEVAGILRRLAAGQTIDQIVANFHRPELTREAIEEAVRLATEVFEDRYASRKAKAA